MRRPPAGLGASDGRRDLEAPSDVMSRRRPGAAAAQQGRGVGQGGAVPLYRPGRGRLPRLAEYDRVAVTRGAAAGLAVRRRVLLVLIASGAAGCSAGAPAYRDETSLRSLTLGEPKAAVLATFGAHDGDAQNNSIPVVAMRMRIRERTGAGDLLEIGEVPLIDRSSGRVTYYWVLFENGRLAVWGRPEEWRLVAGRYPIRFRPTQTAK